MCFFHFPGITFSSWEKDILTLPWHSSIRCLMSYPPRGLIMRYLQISILSLVGMDLHLSRGYSTLASTASASFLPTLSYMIFIFLYMRAEFAGALPRKLQRLAPMMLVAFIPLVTIANEISSFIGVSRRMSFCLSLYIYPPSYSHLSTQTWCKLGE
jgi:hypothetical protein